MLLWYENTPIILARRRGVLSGGEVVLFALQPRRLTAHRRPFLQDLEEQKRTVLNTK